MGEQMSPTLALRRLIADAGPGGVVTVAAVTAALAESDGVMLNILACARMVPPERALYEPRNCACVNCNAIAAAVTYMLDAKAAAKP